MFKDKFSAEVAIVSDLLASDGLGLFILILVTFSALSHVTGFPEVRPAPPKKKGSC